MRTTSWIAAAALIAALLAGGCESKCPQPVAYDDKTLHEVQAALDKLPQDSVLRRVMHDYEMERDDLRFCR